MTTTTIDIARLDGGHINLTAQQLDDLDSRIAGRLLRAGDDGWDDALLVWNGMTAKVPALVLQPASAHDVAVAVGFARDHGLLLSIKGGGHDLAGTSIAGRGLTLDLSRMRHISVDPDARLAHVGPGCLLKDLDQATQAHGLATVLGFISEVGVAGLTLGGGLGYLTRRFGWTVDNLLEVEIVTADGQIRTASRDQHAELYWAVRGAGANLGVVAIADGGRRAGGVRDLAVAAAEHQDLDELVKDHPVGDPPPVAAQGMVGVVGALLGQQRTELVPERGDEPGWKGRREFSTDQEASTPS